MTFKQLVVVTRQPKMALTITMSQLAPLSIKMAKGVLQGLLCGRFKKGRTQESAGFATGGAGQVRTGQVEVLAR